MLARRTRRIALTVVLAVTVFVTAALPGSAQDLPAVPSVGDVIAEVGEIEGLAPLDPVLNPISDLVLGLLAQVDDLLAQAPLVNALALGGSDAVDAGVAFSQATFPDGAGTAVISRQDLFADGFSSGGFQGVNDAPLLFTNSEDLDIRTGMELQRLGMSNITILGGETALNPLVVQKLQIAGLNVTRVGGPSRVETSVEAAKVTSPASTTAVLVRGYPDDGMPDSQAYADLLAAGPYAAENGWPILMTSSASLHPAVADHLDNGTITDVVIIGGEGAVSAAVADAVTAQGLEVTRVAGSNRFATAVAIANARGFMSSADSDRLIVAESGSRDDVWAPGFAATAHGSLHRAPVLLTDGAIIPIETLQFVLDGVAANLLDGGPAVICASFVDSVACQAIALLMVGNLADALALIDGLLDILSGLPVLGDILAALGLADLLPAVLQTIVDTLGTAEGAVTGVLGAVASGDPAAVQAALSAAADAVGGDVADILTGTLGAGIAPAEGEAEGDGAGPIGDPTDILDGVVGGAGDEAIDPTDVLADPGAVVGGLLGG